MFTLMAVPGKKLTELVLAEIILQERDRFLEAGVERSTYPY